MNTRQQDIIGLLEASGEMTIKALSDALNVSQMTVHRDLDYLEEQRYLYKKRGAAVFVNSPDRKKSGFYAEEKRRIGMHAASLIKPGQSLLLDNSTTALETARFLDGIPGLTFYTTNIEIASLVAGYRDTVLYCIGGYYFSDSKGFVGAQTEAFVDTIHADTCIIGASGIDIAAGITNPYPMHSSLQRKIIEAADFKLLVADHSKFGKRAVEKAAALSEIDCIVTDAGINEAVLTEYRKHTNIEIAE